MPNEGSYEVALKRSKPSSDPNQIDKFVFEGQTQLGVER